MDLVQSFEEAQVKVKDLTKRPSNEELLDLYALFKQATEGDNTSSKPGMFDMKGQFKWKQWTAKAGMGKEEAMQAYVDLVGRLMTSYS